MTVIPFPNTSADPHTDPMATVTDALERMNILMGAYLEPGEPRPSAEYILMAISGVLEEPKLCAAAGIERPRAAEEQER